MSKKKIFMYFSLFCITLLLMQILPDFMDFLLGSLYTNMFYVIATFKD